MILRMLTLENFRQFRGVQTVEFAGGGADGPNITVVLGENGRGKTGLYRALMFCLYGESVLVQDEGTSRGELYLVNKAAVAELGTGESLSARVSVKFSHHSVPFEITRWIRAVRQGDRQIEQIDRVELRTQDPNGNAVLIDNPREVLESVDRVLDRRVREYFLFDGERIEHLTRASASQRVEVQKGITCLLNIDDLEKSIRVTKRLRDVLTAELQEVSQGDYARVNAALGDVEDELTANRDSQQSLTEQIAAAEAQLSHLRSQQEAHEHIGALARERNQLDQRRTQLRDESRDMLQAMREQVGPSAVLLANGLIDSVFAEVDSRRRAGEIPSALRKDLIEKIIEDRVCICHREVVPGTDAFDAIIEWKNRTVDEATENAAMELWRFLSGLRDRFDHVRVFLETTVQRYADMKNEIEQLSGRIESLDEEIGDRERADGTDLQRLIDGTIRDLGRYESELSTRQDEREELEAKKKELQAEREEIERQQSVKSELDKRVRLAVQTHEALVEVRDEFTQEMKDRLSAAASEHFSMLLDDDSKRMLRRIVVQDDYSLQVMDPWDRPFLANISAGQRQIVSLSFILALAEAAASSDVFEMPLFTDTPFGRLSWQHRENLIREIPDEAAQWILLATDTEIGRREASFMLSGGRWGRLHVLEPQQDGSTRISEYPVEQALSLLSRQEAN
jgi:DNA sulfur modification protein DndD